MSSSLSVGILSSSSVDSSITFSTTSSSLSVIVSFSSSSSMEPLSSSSSSVVMVRPSSSLQPSSSSSSVVLLSLSPSSSMKPSSSSSSVAIVGPVPSSSLEPSSSSSSVVLVSPSPTSSLQPSSSYSSVVMVSPSPSSSIKPSSSSSSVFMVSPSPSSSLQPLSSSSSVVMVSPSPSSSLQPLSSFSSVVLLSPSPSSWLQPSSSYSSVFVVRPSPSSSLKPSSSSSSVFIVSPTPSSSMKPSSSSAAVLPTTSPAPPRNQNMYPYGADAQDKSDDRDYDDRRCVEFVIGYEGFLFFAKRHYKLHVCRNGLITFEEPWYRKWPYNFGQYHWMDRQPLLAPYWSLIDKTDSFREGISKLYYHVYKKGDGNEKTQGILARAVEDVKKHCQYNRLPTDFIEATWVMVVTWVKLRHRDSQWEENIKQLYNTFQAVLITNGVYSFVMYNYPENGINWSGPYVSSSDNYELYWKSPVLPVVGINSGDRNKLAYNHPRSGRADVVEIDQHEGLNIFKSRHSNSFDASLNGVRGRLFFRLEDSLGKEQARTQCIRWYYDQGEMWWYMRFVQPCPCTYWQARRDRRFRWSSWQWPRYCFYTSFPSIYGMGQECCYVFFRQSFSWWWGWWSWGSYLASGYPDGGTVHRYHKYRYPFLYEREDVKPYENCCIHSDMCWMYYERHPSDTCWRYIPPRWSWFWGDPHFVTLDNKNYTFNGLGEFVMLDAKNGHFQLQARTKLAKGDGKATVFSGAVAKETNTSTVQVLLADNGTLEVSVDGQPYNINNLTNTTQQLNGSVDVVKPEKNCFEMGFPSGMSVKVCENLNQLSIIAAAPDSFKNNTKGLLGTWNDDAEDDFTLPNGTVLPASSSGRDVHYKFGMTWQVTNDTSLFTYKHGESVNTFVNASFQPTFIEDYMSSFGNDSLKQEAIALCKGDVSCLFDIASTKDIALGESAKQINSQLVNDSKKMSNEPPRIDNSSLVLKLTVNQTATIVVNATDPDNDVMTFNVSGAPSDAKVTTGQNAIQVSWKVTNEKLDLQYIVTDSNDAVSSIKPTIYLCACHNGANCSKPTITSGANNTETKFIRMVCTCAPGYTGVTCETDLDACEANLEPCYPGVKCIDLPAPANMTTGYECGPCPSGYTGSGADCKDIDECSNGNSGCKQLCLNKPGSFECSCNPGYQLNVDRKTCDDINECERGSDCMHVCTNHPGNYSCSCYEYFKVDPKNNKLCVPKNPCNGGEHRCKHICYQDNDEQQKCACNQGYKLNDDGKTCSDIDECASKKYRCNQKCHNTQGSYTCSCVDGFELSNDNFTCVDINECIRWTFNCSDQSQICENTQGSYKCTCQEGLYLINNKCISIRPGGTIPPPPTAPAPAPAPKEPSKDEASNAVNITMGNLNVKQWNKPKEDKFKEIIAEGMTKYCGKNEVCRPTSSKRVKRSLNGFITFTADQVHLLPGFPVQIISDKYPASLYVARIAIYVNYPPGVILETKTSLKAQILLSVLNTTRGEVEKALNVTVLEIKGYKTEQPIKPSVKKEDDTLTYIIIGASAGGVVLIFLIALIVYCYLKPSNAATDRNKVNGHDNRGMQMHQMSSAHEVEIGDEVILQRHDQRHSGSSSGSNPRASARVAPVE